ncbi:response regulator transcription factor [Dyadobacter sp. CY312]|uniref:LuxR C-terminal-related transcriptional regulator n=1 Tax=Dyadobacter sp. CY312 TaxID=2907303 RepID=UPI001F1B0DE0|nr:response regulator transcription factor [Dyadobacter sp. CY312]MCE7044643.1 response regulator transcription factor [Dyadobacter sp. CY312]
MSKILLIDNYPIALEGLRHFLGAKFGQASLFGSTSIHSARSKQDFPTPDLIILGVNECVVQENLRIVKFCLASYPSVPLVIYDQHVDSGKFLAYLKLGVKGCILKENPSGEIASCIEKVLGGKIYLAPAVLEILISNTLLTPRFPESQKDRRLSPRENQVASYLTQGNGTKWISEKLNIKPSTVSTMKRNVFLKMKVNNVIQLQEVFKSEA